MTSEPTNDRDSHTGRFRPGNRAGRGNPHARRVARLRAEFLRSVSPEDVRVVVLALVTQAKQGNVAAVRELLDRTLGRPIEADIVARIEELEGRADALDREGPVLE